MNIDTQTVHDLVTRQIDLLRYERSVRRDVLKQLADMQAEVESRLKRSDLSDLTRRELNALLADIETILSRDYDLIASRLKTEQVEAVQDESVWLWAWLAALAAQQNQPEPKPLSETAMKSLSDGLLVGGLTLNEAVAGQKAALMQKIKQAVRVAAVSDGADVVADVADLFKRKARDLTATTATWIGTLSAEVHYAFGKVNPLVKGFRHVSVLDGKTSSICTARHGLVWDKQHNPIGHSYPFRRPALHPHCRSKLVFVFDLDAEFEGLTGEDWVKGRTLEQLQEQFGQGVGEMLHRRIITPNDAVRSDGLQAATLKELKQSRIGYSVNLDKAMRTDWNQFPDVVLMQSKSTISGHDLYQAAKGGDLGAAIDLVNDYLNVETLTKLKAITAQHDNLSLLPVHAVEMSGRNKIPVAYASWLGNILDLPVEYGIIQADRVGRTGADGFERLVKSIRFDGKVEQGKKYLLVDDAVTQGGTLAYLKGYIESNGGTVVAATTLMGKPHSAKLAITKPTLGQLRKFVGKDFEAWWEQEFGYDLSKLTESEARYINKQIHRSGVDTIRDAIIARRLETVRNSGS